MPSHVQPNPVRKALDLKLAERLKLPTDRVYQIDATLEPGWEKVTVEWRGVDQIPIPEFEAMRQAARDEVSVTHQCPHDGTGTTPCCGRPPFELPRYDRLAAEARHVTCEGPKR
jgi:hypothetical protein